MYSSLLDQLPLLSCRLPPEQWQMAVKLAVYISTFDFLTVKMMNIFPKVLKKKAL